MALSEHSLLRFYMKKVSINYVQIMLCMDFIIKSTWHHEIISRRFMVENYITFRANYNNFIIQSNNLVYFKSK